MKRLFAIVIVLASSASVADIELLGTGTGFVVNRNHVVTARISIVVIRSL